MTREDVLPFAERLWARIERGSNGECWRWLSWHDADGYAGWRVMGAPSRRPQRLIYALERGEFDNALVIDHLCRNRWCVNPWHMEPVTGVENVLRGVGPAATHARETHCKRGHPFTEENTYPNHNGRGCRACKREKQNAPGYRARANEMRRRRRRAARTYDEPEAA